MVKQTFLNLPEPKREQIISVALEEFATNTYSKASLNNIVNKAGISKGSLYQYFGDKKDLYLFITKDAVEKKLAYISQYVKADADFFEWFEQLGIAAIEFNMKNPLLGRFILNTMEPFSEDIFLESIESSKRLALEFFENKIKAAKEQGAIRSDIDVKLAANFIFSAWLGMINYILESLGVNVKGYLENEIVCQEATEKIIKQKTSQIMSILRVGFQPRNEWQGSK